MIDLLIVAVSFFALAAIGVPIMAALGITSLVGIVVLEDVPLSLIAQRATGAPDNFILLAIPLFILAGGIMNEGGISRRLFTLADVVVGHWTGGLAQVNVALSVMNGGLSGSSIADVAFDCKVLVPQMKAAGYPASFSAAISASTGILANVIPPSIGMILYASLAGISIGALFVSGIMPGILLAIALMVVAHRYSVRRSFGGNRARATRREVISAFGAGLWALSLPVTIIVGIRFGYFTATEAGSIAVMVALVLGVVVYREIRPSDLGRILLRSAIDTGVIMIIVALSAPLAWLMAIHRIPALLTHAFNSIGTSQIVFLLLVNVVLLVAGSLMEGTTLTILATPVLAPVAAGLGIDPVHFGLIVVMNIVIGTITPPFGQSVFFASSLTGVPVEQVFRDVMRFVPWLLVVLMIVTYAPDLVMWTVPLFGP